MEIKLKSSLSQKKTLLILSLSCLLVGVISAFVGDIFVPVICALLALIFVFDNDKKSFALAISVLLVVINAFAIGFGLTMNLFGLQSVIMAIVFYCAFRKSRTKTETVLILTIICAVFSVLNLALIPVNELGSFNLSGIVAYYEALITELRSLFIEIAYATYSQALQQSGIEITESIIATIFDTQLTLVISYIVIIALVCVGVFTKLFDALSAKLAEDATPVASWRFMTSSIFAYFYVAMMILLIFTSASGGVIGIAVSNLYNIFLVIYAYVGFNFVLALISTRIKPLTAVIILFVVMALTMSLALQFLSVFGVMFTIRKNRELTPRED